MIVEILNPDNYQTSPFALPTLLTASIMLALGLRVLIGEHRSRVTISFFVMTTTAALWLSSYSLMYCALDERVAAGWSRIGQVGILFIPASVYHFTLAALGNYERLKRRVWLIWEISLGFLLTVFTGDAFIRGMRRYDWGYYPMYNWMATLFICFFCALMALSLLGYWRAYRTAPAGAARLRSQGLLRAFGIAYLGSFISLRRTASRSIPLATSRVGVHPICQPYDSTLPLDRYHPQLAAKQIINAMEDALLILDSDGIVRVANHGAYEIFLHREATSKARRYRRSRRPLRRSRIPSRVSFSTAGYATMNIPPPRRHHREPVILRHARRGPSSDRHGLHGPRHHQRKIHAA